MGVGLVGGYLEYGQWKTAALKEELLWIGLNVPRLKKERLATLENYIRQHSITDPICLIKGATTCWVIRGGAWSSDALDVEVNCFKFHRVLSTRDNSLGFRIRRRTN